MRVRIDRPVEKGDVDTPAATDTQRNLSTGFALPKIISRKDALAVGLKHYFNGRACPKGHISKRYVSSMTCLQCGRDQNAKKVKGVKAHFHPFCKIWKAAKACGTRREFKERFPRYYLAAHKRGIMQVICTHMPPAKTSAKWTLCKVYNLTRKYSTHGEFAKKHSGAIDYAITKGIWPLVSGHMERLNSDYNAIYIWGYANGSELICKFGVTSQRLGMERIESVSRKSGLPCEFAILAKSRKAFEAERALKEIGNPTDMSGFNGATEFRILTPNELTKAYGVIYEHADR